MFVSTASEWDDRPELRVQIEDHIRRLAEELLAEPAPPARGPEDDR